MYKSKTHIKTGELKLEAFQEELKNILDWWILHTLDVETNGFIGRVDGFGKTFPQADRGAVMISRIAWAFSAAGRLGNKEYVGWARYAYHYFKSNFVDQEFGGIYWMINHAGAFTEGKKQIYAQAFGIYASCEYYLLTKDESALQVAENLFDLIELHALDKVNGGYYEAFSRTWEPMKEVSLSEKEGNDVKTMNTHLHILEAYTLLLQCKSDAKVEHALKNLMYVYIDRFVDPETGRLKLFFDEHWNENRTHESYGHEIESAWLLVEAAKVLRDPLLTDKVQKISQQLTQHVIARGIDSNGAVINEKNFEGHVDTQRDWWPQAEAVVGFYEAYEQFELLEYRIQAERVWTYIQNFMIDSEKGEWFWSCSADGIANRAEDKAGPWKSCYHNSRMCIEMIKRLM